MRDKKSLGVVETQYLPLPLSDGQMQLELGQILRPVTLAYETYGILNKERDNAILVLHALSGDAHAAGYHQSDEKPGWWDNMIGPSKALDTDKYFVICSNVLGGCKGSTGPSSLNPITGKPYGLDFPMITVGDMVHAQKHLVDQLGIKRLFAVIGGSMGGMQALEWVSAYPDCVRCVIPIATALKNSPRQIALNEVGRQAVMSDVSWNHGNYYETDKPEKGLAVARMLGHITFMSEKSMEQKFARRLKEKEKEFKFNAEFEVEGYLKYRGESFVKRFDANTYLYITKALDYFDRSGERLIHKHLPEDVRFLVIAFKSDWLYPPHQSQEIVKLLKTRHVPATYCEINASYGHDSFLVEPDEQAHLVRHFLDKAFTGK